MLRTTSLVSLSLASMTAIASAQGTTDAPADPSAMPADPSAIPGQPAVATAPDPNASASMMAPPPPPPPVTGPTLRNGFSLTVGQEFGTSNLNNEFSGQLYGVDWRIGMQLSEALGVYLHSHLSLGTITINQADNITGNFATAVVGEYTLPMRLFVGGGAGYGVLNNPSGPLVEARVGFYPFEAPKQGKARRLNVALDTRLYFVSEGPENMTMKHISISLGYDRF
jgi:hypothetical protein